VVKWLGREPAMYLALALAAAQTVAALAHMDPDQQNALSVGVTALYTVLLGLLTRPIDASVLTGAVATLATCAGVFGFDVAADVVSGVNALLVAVLTVALTTRVSPAPRIDPRQPAVAAARGGRRM
jgi:hypothetical protein